LLAFSTQTRRRVIELKTENRPDEGRRLTAKSRQSKSVHRTSVVVLAAGTSSRFGSPKQVATLGGKTLIEHVVDSIPGARVREVVVVAGHDHAAVKKALGRREKVRVAINLSYADGMSTSIKAGLSALHEDASGIMILLADQPFVTRSLLEKMLKRYGAGDKIVGVSVGSIVTPPVIFPRAFFHELRMLEGDQGARSVIQRHAKDLLVVKTISKTSTDIDTKEDMRLARRKLV
jgi:molybdenum cofactor cytidylyltransferase